MIQLAAEKTHWRRNRLVTKHLVALRKKYDNYCGNSLNVDVNSDDNDNDNGNYHQIIEEMPVTLYYH